MSCKGSSHPKYLWVESFITCVFICYCYLTEVATRFEILDVSFLFFKPRCNFMADVFKPPKKVQDENADTALIVVV